MITHTIYPSLPWSLRETTLEIKFLAQSESLFALSNGHVGLRGNLDEGEPHELPGTYLNSFYELRPLPYAEAGYGYPESGQSIINVTDGKIIRLHVDDEPFDIRYGECLRHVRELSFRDGTLHRSVSWRSPTGRRVDLETTRLVSLTQRAIAAVHYRVTAVDAVDIVVQSELVANEPMPGNAYRDPRTAFVLEGPLIPEYQQASGERATLMHRTRHSDLLMAAAMDHDVVDTHNVVSRTEVEEDLARVTMTTRLQPGETIEFVKYLAYGWSAQRSQPAIRAQVEGALFAARATGFGGLCREQRGFLDDYWARADVEVEGDPDLQQAVRFALFHVLQSSARAERRPIPAKGLTGPGYDGHSFWDTECFVLPVLTYTMPEASRNALLWRCSTIRSARDRAQTLGLEGAAFPWRTIHGEECSGYWPAGTAAFHINADIADAAIRYVNATRDLEFERGPLVELVTETARLWRSVGHREADGLFHIDGVTGPDEYSAISDDNLYTNVMAQRNLAVAAYLADKHPVQARQCGIEPDEIDTWREIARSMCIPFDHDLQVHAQSKEFTAHERWDFAGTGPDEYPLLLHFPYFELYRKQVVKQADLVLALHLRGDLFSHEEKRRAFVYYDELTVRDSSLSACTQCVIAAEVGLEDLAYEYLREAAMVDLDDLYHNARDGLHLAALAGTWIALVAGFGGLRDCGEDLVFDPRLPSALSRVAFTINWRGTHVRVEVDRTCARYRLVDGEPVVLIHAGQPFTLEAGKAIERPLRMPPYLEPPTQPPGREPKRHMEGSRLTKR